MPERPDIKLDDDALVNSLIGAAGHTLVVEFSWGGGAAYDRVERDMNHCGYLDELRWRLRQARKSDRATVTSGELIRGDGLILTKESGDIGDQMIVTESHGEHEVWLLAGRNPIWYRRIATCECLNHALGIACGTIPESKPRMQKVQFEFAVEEVERIRQLQAKLKLPTMVSVVRRALNFMWDMATALEEGKELYVEEADGSRTKVLLGNLRG